MIDAAWLVEREKRYGGYVEMEHANGGDRMSVHGYAPAYARALSEFVERNGSDLTLVEIGVLRGTGLAIWCDLFPRVYGLDIRPEVFQAYRPELLAAGAFTTTEPVVRHFDQFAATPEVVRRIPIHGAPAIVIDDGCHEDAATLRTLEAFLPHLAPDFLYFVEDQPRKSRIHARLQQDAFGLKATRIHRSLTVLTP